MGGVKIQKCCKCSNTSANSTASFHRFLKPGKTNLHRAKLWAKWAFPQEDTSVEKLQNLFASNLLICSDHFSTDSFLEHNSKHLHRNSVPIGALLPDHRKSATTSISSNPAFNSPIPNTSLNISTTDDENFSGATVVNTTAVKRKAECNKTAILSSSSSSSEITQTPTLQSQYTVKRKAETEDDTIPKKCRLSPPSPSPECTPSSRKNSTPKKCPNIAQRKPRQSLLGIINSTRVDQLTPKKKKLYYECRKYAREVSKVQHRYKHLRSRQKLEKLATDETLDKVLKKMTPAAALLFRSQLRNCSDKKPKGRRWTREEKILGLTIYKKSPSCYRLLRKIFVLPSPTCVKSLLSSVHINTGLNENVLATLARAVSKMKPGCDHCVLLFDEVALRRQLLYNQHKDQIDGYQDHGIHGRSRGLANQALVFMLVGLKRKWKQPVAFYLSSGGVSGVRLHVIVKEVLKACFDIGLKVLGTICDMGANNVKAVDLLKEKAYDSYFTLEDRQVAVVYDPCHLLKCFRNNLRKYDVTYDMKSNIVGFNKRGTASWRHIRALYERDNREGQIFQLARKLTKSHIDPNCKEAMKVNLAAQVLSHTVSACLDALDGLKGNERQLGMEELEELDEDESQEEHSNKEHEEENFVGAAETALLVKNMDTLFDSLNSSISSKKASKEFQRVLSNKSRHLQLWAEEKKIIKNMQFLTPTGRQPPSKDAWISTLNGAEQIWQSIQSAGFSFLETRRLNQDPLENFFGDVRYMCGSNNNPNESQFVAAFKSCLLSGLNYEDLHGGNCTGDGMFLLDNLQSLIEASEKASKIDMESREYPIIGNNIGGMGHLRRTLEKKNYSVVYVSGFVAKRMMDLSSDIRQCGICVEELTSDILDENNRFIFLKEYSADMERLTYPSFSLAECVAKCTTIIYDFLDKKAHMSNIKSELLAIIQRDEALFHWLTCYDHKCSNVSMLLESVFFISVRHWCRKRNQRLLQEEKERALKRKTKILKGF